MRKIKIVQNTKISQVIGEDGNLKNESKGFRTHLEDAAGNVISREYYALIDFGNDNMQFVM